MRLFEDLPGTITVGVSNAHADYFVRNISVVFVEQDLHDGHRPIAGWLPMTPAMLEEKALVASALDMALSSVFRPWTKPDPIAVPVVHLFPRLEALAQQVRRCR